MADGFQGKREIDAWPKRRRIALIGTRQPPHPSMHLCSAFRRLFKATSKAASAAHTLTLTREGSALASHTCWGTWVAPTSAVPSGNPSALQAVGMLDWAGTPLHLTVTDAASASRTTGFPIEVSHILGASALLLCFSPYDRDSFVAMQQLYQSIHSSLAPIRLLVVAVVDHEPEGSADRHNLRQPGPTAKLRVGNRTLAPSAGIFADRAVGRSAKERVVSAVEAQAIAAEWQCEYVEVGVMNPDAEKLTRLVDLALGVPRSVIARAALSKPRVDEPTEKVAVRAPREATAVDAGKSLPRGYDPLETTKSRSQPRPLARPKPRSDCVVT
jgi:hypothetical protein